MNDKLDEWIDNNGMTLYQHLYFSWCKNIRKTCPCQCHSDESMDEHGGCCDICYYYSCRRCCE